MKYINKIYFKLLLTIILFLISIFIINNQFISNFIWWFPDLFGDLRTPVRWLECANLGYNFYEDSVTFMECAKREFNYGKIFFQVPFSENLKFFYIRILPYLLIFFSIYYIFKIFDIKSFLSLIIPVLVVLNPSTFLLFSGANIDLLIFIFLIFTAYNRFFLINWFIYFFLTFVKIYPAVLFLNIFFENNRRSIKNVLVIFITIIILSSLYLYFNFSEYLYFLNNLSGAKAGYHYLFSLKSFAKILKYIIDFNYILLLFFTYSIFIYLIVKIYKTINDNFDKKSFKNDFYYCLEFRLFIISSYISIISFIFFSNFFHREIFLVGTIPLILKLDVQNKIFSIRLILILYLIKIIFSYIYSFFNVHDGLIYINNQRVFSDYFLIIISIKSFIDYILMAMITALSVYQTKLFYNYLKIKDEIKF